MNKTVIGSKSWNDEMYEKHATPYNGIAGFIQYRRLSRIQKNFRRFVKSKTGNVLEIGCEEGNLLRYMKSQFPAYRYAGADISASALADAREFTGSKIDYRLLDITQEPYVASPLPDVLICSETLEHIPDVVSAVDNVAKSVNSDAVVIVTVPIEKYKNNIKKFLTRIGLFNLLFKGIEESLSEWHVQDFSKADILNLVDPHFEVVHYETIWLMHQLLVLKPKS